MYFSIFLLILSASQIWASDSCVLNEYMIGGDTYSEEDLCLDSAKLEIREKETGNIINATDSIYEITEVFEKNTISIIGDYTKQTFKYLAGGLIVMSGIALGGKDIGEYGLRLINEHEFYDCMENEKYTRTRYEKKVIQVSEISLENCEIVNNSDPIYINSEATADPNQAEVRSDSVQISISNNSPNEYETGSTNSNIEKEWKPKHSYSVAAGVIGALVTTIAGYYIAGKLGYMSSDNDGIVSPPPGLILTPLITIPVGAIIGICIDELTE